MLESAITPETAFVPNGADVVFECLAFANFADLSISFEWSYPPHLSASVLVAGPILVVMDVDSGAEVNFTCTVSQEGTGLTDIAFSTIVLGESTPSILLYIRPPQAGK